jgi:predicted dehydrogenase
VKKYSAVVVGAGMGGKLSMRALTQSERFELVGVADWKEEARREAEAEFPGIRTFADCDALFSHCPADVVCVASWPPSHLEATQKGLELPLKGILVEKPLADTFADGAQVLAAVREKGLPMAVPHGLLVAPHVKEIVERVQSGQIGTLELIEIRCTGWDIINAGIHWLNFCVVLTGGEEVDYVMAACDASTRTFRDGMQVETLAATYVQLHNGTRIVMNTGDYVEIGREGKGVLFRLVGTRGIIEFYAWESCYRLFDGAHPEGELIEVETAPGSAHQRHLERLAGEMDAGEADYGVAESSLRALELCEAAYLSARHGCAVRLPLAGFAPPPASDWAPGLPYGGEGGGRDGRQLPPVEDL